MAVRCGWRRFLALSFAILLGCGGGGGAAGEPDHPGSGMEGDSGPGTSDGGWLNVTMGVSGPGKFTFSPLDAADLLEIVALGSLSPPAHSIPTDHMYFQVTGEKTVLRAVRAPAGGVIVGIVYPGDDSGIDIRVTDTFVYRMAHVKLDSSLKIGDGIAAGQTLGTTSGYAAGVDLGVVNEQMTLSGFLQPVRYHYANLHCDSPLKSYEAPLQSQLYAKVSRQGAEKDGKIDYDVSGRLIGNWFWDGVPVELGHQDKTISFVPNAFDSTKIWVGVAGSPLAVSGRFALAEEVNSPSHPLHPANVSVSTGKVCYRLYQANWNSPPGSEQVGLLLVQLLEEQKIKVELISPSQDGSAEFTGNARIYIR